MRQILSQKTKMPEYTYRCESCDKIHEVKHSIKEKLTDCIFCEKLDTLVRLPSTVNIARVITSDSSTPQKAGKIVEEYIKEQREELKREKQGLKTKEYKT